MKEVATQTRHDCEYEDETRNHITWRFPIHARAERPNDPRRRTARRLLPQEARQTETSDPEVGQAFSFCLLTRRAVKINSRTDFNMKDKLNPKVTTTAIQKRFGLLSR